MDIENKDCEDTPNREELKFQLNAFLILLFSWLSNNLSFVNSASASLVVILWQLKPHFALGPHNIYKYNNACHLLKCLSIFPKI